jgi:hypothetical protein
LEVAVAEAAKTISKGWGLVVCNGEDRGWHWTCSFKEKTIILGSCQSSLGHMFAGYEYLSRLTSSI